jgi:hypothetical protein
MIAPVNNGGKSMTAISELLNPREAASKLRTTCGTLAVWRCTRRKPLRFVRMGRKIFYKAEDLQRFIDLQTDPGDGEKPRHFSKKAVR